MGTKDTARSSLDNINIGSHRYEGPGSVLLAPTVEGKGLLRKCRWYCMPSIGCRAGISNRVLASMPVGCWLTSRFLGEMGFSSVSGERVFFQGDDGSSMMGFKVRMRPREH